MSNRQEDWNRRRDLELSGITGDKEARLAFAEIAIFDYESDKALTFLIVVSHLNDPTQTESSVMLFYLRNVIYQNLMRVSEVLEAETGKTVQIVWATNLLKSELNKNNLKEKKERVAQKSNNLEAYHEEFFADLTGGYSENEDFRKLLNSCYAFLDSRLILALALYPKGGKAFIYRHILKILLKDATKKPTRHDKSLKVINQQLRNKNLPDLPSEDRLIDLDLDMDEDIKRSVS